MGSNFKRGEMGGTMFDLLNRADYARDGEANKPIVRMGALVEEVVSFDERIRFSRNSVKTDHGECVAPLVAGSLLYQSHDFARPRKFILGLWDAIQTVLNSKPYPFGQVEVLYIGTGPFATLTLPLTACFPSSVLNVHAVDVSQESLNCVDRVVRHFEMEDSYPSRTCADATTVDWSKCLKKVPHIVVTECMASALLGEPQIAIVQNLISQIGPDFILVPENIAIDVGTSTPTHMGPSQPFFSLDRTGVTMKRGTYEPKSQLVTGVFQRPDESGFPSEWTPHLETTVRTFGRHTLSGKDSDITRTENLKPLAGSVKEARITYELGGTTKSIKVQGRR